MRSTVTSLQRCSRVGLQSAVGPALSPAICSWLQEYAQAGYDSTADAAAAAKAKVTILMWQRPKLKVYHSFFVAFHCCSCRSNTACIHTPQADAAYKHVASSDTQKWIDEQVQVSHKPHTSATHCC